MSCLICIPIIFQKWNLQGAQGALAGSLCIVQWSKSEDTDFISHVHYMCHSTWHIENNITCTSPSWDTL